MAVPESVLSWLYSVLHEYHDPQRTYSDLAQTLAAYPSLAPRTEVYTFESGTSALLVTLSGTLPVDWRGATYRFPVKLCIPHDFPQHAPMVYVVPAKDMMVRPGQHVGVDGRVYHPYLRDWPNMWDRAGTPEFLRLLQQVFAREPPVISRAQQHFQRPMSQQGSSPASSMPPVPPKHNAATSAGAAQSADAANSAPPPLPPKQHGNNAQTPSRNLARDGPPLPPLPRETAEHHPPPQQEYRDPSLPLGAPASGYQNGRPPGPPSLPTVPHQQHYRAHQDRSPVSPVSPVSGYSQHSEAKHLHPQSHPLSQTPQFPSQSWRPSPLSGGSQQIPPQFHIQHQRLPPQPAQQPQTALRKQPAPDLLSDPFEVALPGASSGPPLEAPPVPPNPEKEHLLQALSASLVQQTQQKVSQNVAAIAPLQAQQHALYVAQERLKGEIRQLEQLEQALSSNEVILHRSIKECDHTISTAKSKKQPPIDEVLIAPTMVANQLWNLCAEEAACREAMYVLQKGVDRGRVSGADFVRQMRGLGRECFLKMALARKCARGMGLETRGR